MKSAFFKFGYFMFVDFTFNIVREKPYYDIDAEKDRSGKRQRQFSLGMLTGLSNQLKILTYGLCFCIN